jgi:PKD repeat protein
VKVGVGASFDGSASADPDGQLTTWAFDFGDGSAVVTGASATASHTFTQAGSYTVSLTVTDAQQVTAQASCAVQVKPASLVISELLYRNAGADTGTFIELKGPAGQSLQGYSLVAVNGADGADYATLALSGSIPARGYYLVVHPSAPAALVALADLTSTKVDLQNGPDSLQLRQGTTVVDAVGYGTFTATDTFAGEGRAVADTGDDKSLSRDAQGDDTDDNLTDFHVSARPSPGQPDGANAAPVAKLTCPSTASVGVAAAFDGAGSTDVDGTVVTWAFAFGDGTAGQSGAQSQASHAFAQAGTFTVGLTVTDDQGGTGQVSCTVVVSSAPPQLTSLTVSPATASVAKGLTQAFTATGHYSDGSTKDLSASVTWGSTDATVATVSTAGLASAQATGSTTVTAQSGSLSASATLTVTAPVVTGVTVTPGTPSVLVGKTLPLVATATSSDGSSADVTAQATWSSASTSVATVTAGGVALGQSVGTAKVTASFGGQSAKVTLTVTGRLSLSSTNFTSMYGDADGVQGNDPLTTQYCPAGQLVVGLKYVANGVAGDGEVMGLAARCGDVGFSASNGSLAFTTTPAASTLAWVGVSSASTTSKAGEVDCPAGSVVVGYTGRGSGYGVWSLTFQCGALTATSTAAGWTVGVGSITSLSRIGESNLTSPSPDFSCMNAGPLASGAEGRAIPSSILQAYGLGCTSAYVVP